MSSKGLATSGMASELPKQTTFWAAVGNNRYQQIEVDFEISDKCLICAGTRMPMATNDFRKMVRNKAAIHFYMAIGA